MNPTPLRCAAAGLLAVGAGGMAPGVALEKPRGRRP